LAVACPRGRGPGVAIILLCTVAMDGSPALATAKHAYLALSASERDAFNSFLATTNSVVDADIRLERGDGKRAKFNGKAAAVVHGTKRGGWTDVRLKTGETVSWRNGAWRNVVVSAPVFVDLEPPTTVDVPSDALGMVLARLPLPLRLQALCVSTAWAGIAQEPAAWASLITPLDASRFTAERLEMLIRRAGICLAELDLGDRAGRFTMQSTDLTDDVSLTASPLPATMLSLAANNGWPRLHTFRVRYPLQWLTCSIVKQLVPCCSQLMHLQLKMKLDQEALQLVFLPLLETLDVTVPSQYGQSLPLRLPFDQSPKLCALAVRDFVSGYSHVCSETAIFDRALPASVKSVLLSVPHGQLLEFAPRWPHVQHLYINGRKTNDLVDAQHMQSLQVLQYDAAPYGADDDDFDTFYRSLFGCTSLRYLRVDFKGVNDTIRDEQDAFGPILDLPNLWFCDVPHLARPNRGWSVAAENVDSGQRRLVRKSSEFFDSEQMRRLARSSHAVVPELDFDQHPAVSVSARLPTTIQGHRR
jgi:hypothetical protein